MLKLYLPLGGLLVQKCIWLCIIASAMTCTVHSFIDIPKTKLMISHMVSKRYISLYKCLGLNLISTDKLSMGDWPAGTQGLDGLCLRIWSLLTNVTCLTNTHILQAYQAWSNPSSWWEMFSMLLKGMLGESCDVYVRWPFLILWQN